jgi:hypothetical protein
VADVLRGNPDAPVRVFVVWEPVLATDWGTPSPTLTANVADPRASHFWDPDHRLSAAYGDAPRLDTLADVRKVGFRMKDVVWDTALIYPPGVKWGSPARLLVAPVVKYRDDLAEALAQLAR